jgi:large subunit ribosomal protein L35
MGFGERPAELRHSPAKVLPRRLSIIRARMPKMKSHSGAKKRFKKTGTGKLKARHAFSSHMLEHKSPKRKRSFGLDRDISKADRKTVTKLLGGQGR